ncbi:MAG: hypothetical protein LKF31_03865, partial [Muribaculaceae bacterium]|nr:hypothetical protein [Muribaculaceae bacterium]
MKKLIFTLSIALISAMSLMAAPKVVVQSKTAQAVNATAQSYKANAKAVHAAAVSDAKATNAAAVKAHKDAKAKVKATKRAAKANA